MPKYGYLKHDLYHVERMGDPASDLNEYFSLDELESVMKTMIPKAKLFDKGTRFEMDMNEYGEDWVHTCLPYTGLCDAYWAQEHLENFEEVEESQ